MIAAEGNRLSHVANGQIRTDAKADLPRRLVDLHDRLAETILQHRPQAAAVEEVFVNENPQSTLKLGQARGIALLVPAQAGLVIAEYAPNEVKKTVVGVGHGAKEQIRMMVTMLLPRAKFDSDDSADALAVAICHAHHRATRLRWADSGSAKGHAPA